MFHKLNTFKLRFIKRWRIDELFKFYFLCYIFTIIHFCYFCFFSSLNIITLSAYALFSTMFYIILAVGYVKKKHFLRLIFAIGTEVVCFSLLCTIILGWNFGFMHYLIFMVPVIYYLITTSGIGYSHLISFFTSIAVILIFLITKWKLSPTAVLFHPAINSQIIHTVYCINILLCFMIQSVLRRPEDRIG